MLSTAIQAQLALAPEIDAICQPLKQHFNVTSFVYKKDFNDGSEIRLTNQPQWLEHYYSQQLYKINGFEKHPQHYQSGHVVWSYLSHHQPILNAAREFNIAHGFTIIKKSDDGCEFYFLGTQIDNAHCLNTYLNNLELFEKFIIYFKERGNTLITTASQQKIIIPNKYQQNNSAEQGILYRDSKKQQSFLREVTVNNIYLAPDLKISSRELACAQWLLQGKTAREIANMLFLSPRTIETHINHLKDKLNCRTKSALIDKLLALKIHRLHCKETD